MPQFMNEAIDRLAGMSDEEFLAEIGLKLGINPELLKKGVNMNENPLPWSATFGDASEVIQKAVEDLKAFKNRPLGDNLVFWDPIPPPTPPLTEEEAASCAALFALMRSDYRIKFQNTPEKDKPKAYLHWDPEEIKVPEAEAKCAALFNLMRQADNILDKEAKFPPDSKNGMCQEIIVPSSFPADEV